MTTVRHPLRRRGRLAGIALVGVLSMLALTGCLSINADMTINSDAKGTGTFALSLQKQAAKLLGITDLTTFTSGIKQDDTSGGMLKSATCKASETSDNYVYTCSFTDETFTKPDELWTVNKSGNTIVFAMKNNPSSSATNGQNADLVGGGSLGDVTVNVTFPGTIQSVTGTGATKTSDTTATVKGAMTDSFDVSIVSATSSRAPIGLIIAIIAGALILIAIVIALIWFLLRRRSKAPEGPALDAGTGAEAVAGAAVVSAAGIGAAAPVSAETVPTEAATVETAIADTTVTDEAAATVAPADTTATDAVAAETAEPTTAPDAPVEPPAE